MVHRSQGIDPGDYVMYYNYLDFEARINCEPGTEWSVSWAYQALK